jgi:hypothetical protein
MIGRCEGCGAPTRTLDTKAGSVVIDPDPVADGTIILRANLMVCRSCSRRGQGDGHAGWHRSPMVAIALAPVLLAALSPDEPRYRAHSLTCAWLAEEHPNATWRSRLRSGGAS